MPPAASAAAWKASTVARSSARERDVRAGAERLALRDPEDGVLPSGPNAAAFELLERGRLLHPERLERLPIERAARGEVLHVYADMIEHDCSLLVVSDT